jgi:hypothetical protein
MGKSMTSYVNVLQVQIVQFFIVEKKRIERTNIIIFLLFLVGNLLVKIEGRKVSYKSHNSMIF